MNRSQHSGPSLTSLDIQIDCIKYTALVLGQWPVIYIHLYFAVELRLVTKRGKTSDSRDLTAGRVEVLYNGQWGTICWDGFDEADASVLCHILTGSSMVLRYGRVGSEGLQ